LSVRALSANKAKGEGKNAEVAITAKRLNREILLHPKDTHKKRPASQLYLVDIIWLNKKMTRHNQKKNDFFLAFFHHFFAS
jgi:hypothetical protein